MLTWRNRQLPMHRDIARDPPSLHPVQDRTSRPTEIDMRELASPSSISHTTYLEFQLPAASHGCMFKSLDDTHVRILQSGVFADKDNLHCLVQTLGATRKTSTLWIPTMIIADSP